MPESGRSTVLGRTGPSVGNRGAPQSRGAPLPYVSGKGCELHARDRERLAVLGMDSNTNISSVEPNVTAITVIPAGNG